MNVRSDNTWLIVAVGSAVAAASLAVIVMLSAAAGNMVLAVISTASLILFAACAATAWTIRSRTAKIKSTEEEVRCLKLKKAGFDGRSEAIVPKGKMPKG